MKPRVGRTPDVLRKGGAMRDRTKYHRPAAVEWNGNVDLVECQACGEVAAPEEGGACLDCEHVPQYA